MMVTPESYSLYKALDNKCDDIQMQHDPGVAPPSGPESHPFRRALEDVSPSNLHPNNPTCTVRYHRTP